MAHPFAHHRHHLVEKRRAHELAGGRLAYATGGAVQHAKHGAEEEDDSFETDRAVASDHVHKRQRHLQSAHPSRKHGGEVHGKKAKHRLDRKRGGKAYSPGSEKQALKNIKALEKHEHAEIEYERKHRAAGGRAAHKGRKGHVTTNVIVAPQGGGAPRPPMAMPPPMARPPMVAPPPRPPMPPPGAAPPGGPPMAPPGGPPPGLAPGMMPRKRGGRTVGVRNQGPGDRMPEQAPGWREGEKNKTPVQHTDGKTDGGDIGRRKPITYARGGGVARGTSVSIPPLKRGENNVSRAVKPIAAVDHTSRAAPPATPYHGRPKGGGKSGVGRLQKSHEAHAGDAP